MLCQKSPRNKSRLFGNLFLFPSGTESCGLMGSHIVIGLAGQFGAGCTKVGEYLDEKGFHYYSLPDIVKVSLMSLGNNNYE